MAVIPSLWAAAIREGLVDDVEALTEIYALPFSHRVSGLRTLLPVLSDERVDEVLDHVTLPGWQPPPEQQHVGLWVSGGAGDPLIGDLSIWLIKRGDLERALTLFDRIEHIPTRVAVMHAFRPVVEAKAWAKLRSQTVERARRSIEPPQKKMSAANVRALFSLCASSELFEASRALELVNEAISLLPPNGTDDRWLYFPGGLMLLPLAQPVIEALDRRGLREEIRQIGAHDPDFWEWFDDRDDWDPVANALEAWQKSRDGTWLPAALSQHLEYLPPEFLDEALTIARAGLAAEPGHVNWILGFGELAHRLGRANVTREFRDHVVAHEKNIQWERFDPSVHIWNQSKLFDLLSKGERRSILIAALERTRTQDDG